MVKREFIVERQGRSFVLYAGLLDLAHSLGLKSIRTQLIQIPSEENGQTAIVVAEAEFEKGAFTGMGDANPRNVASAMQHCTIRLAETRAKARALRDAVNVGVAAFEELGEGDDGDDATEPATVTARWSGASSDDRATTFGGIRGPASANSNLATPAQVRAIYSIGRDQHNLVEADVDQRSVSLFGTVPSELNKKQASEFISSLKAGTPSK